MSMRHCRSKISELEAGLLKELLQGLYNPNGCKLTATVFASQPNSDPQVISRLWNEGMEIAVLPPAGAQASTVDVKKARDWLSSQANIPNEFIVGVQAPNVFLDEDGRKGLLQAGIEYDHSATAAPVNPFIGAYPFSITITSPLSETLQFWQMPVLPALVPPRPVYVNGPAFGGGVPTLSQALAQRLLFSYNGNRSPVSVHVSGSNLRDQTFRDQVREFMKFAVSLHDVWFVTGAQTINFMRSPMTWGEMIEKELPACSSTSRTAPSGPSEPGLQVSHGGISIGDSGVNHLQTSGLTAKSPSASQSRGSGTGDEAGPILQHCPSGYRGPNCSLRVTKEPLEAKQVSELANDYNVIVPWPTDADLISPSVTKPVPKTRQSLATSLGTNGHSENVGDNRHKDPGVLVQSPSVGDTKDPQVNRWDTSITDRNDEVVRQHEIESRHEFTSDGKKGHKSSFKVTQTDDVKEVSRLDKLELVHTPPPTVISTTIPPLKVSVLLSFNNDSHLDLVPYRKSLQQRRQLQSLPLQLHPGKPRKLQKISVKWIQLQQCPNLPRDPCH